MLKKVESSFQLNSSKLSIFKKPEHEYHAQSSNELSQSNCETDFENASDDIGNLMAYGSAPVLDLSSLDSDCKFLIQKLGKISAWKKKYSESESVVSWLRDWKLRRKEEKAILLYESILPKLKQAENDLKLWLETISTKKWKLYKEAIEMMDHMLKYFTDVDRKTDTLDNILDEARVINVSLVRENVKIKQMIECYEVKKNSFLCFVIFLTIIIITNVL